MTNLDLELFRLKRIRPFTHRWNWKSRCGERERKGLKVAIYAIGNKNSALVETEDGEIIVCSRNCLKEIDSL